MATATAVKERPIIFTGHSLPAMLDGRKTQTRRIVKGVSGEGEFDPDFSGNFPKHGMDEVRFEDGFAVFEWQVGIADTCEHKVRCPYGMPGEKLWVKEAWSPDHTAFYPHFPVVYRADDLLSDWEIEGRKVYSPEANYHFPFKWRSPLFMPRHYSRILLEITEIRVERLHAITEEDAIAEGFRPWTHRTEGTITALRQFRETWETFNAKRGFGWELNPWVFAVGFKRLEPS